ncbi:MAG: MBL fold metallo-hydrolase [Cyclonatronaceae bacterium]
MQITVLTVNPFQENTYVISNGTDAVLVDSGFSTAAEFGQLRRLTGDDGLNLKAVLLTHAHVDHVLGLQRVLDYYDVPVYLSHTDLHLWENYMSQAALFGFEAKPFGFTPKDYPPDRITTGGMTFHIIPTPGHAPDHVSLYSPEHSVLIAGDVLFRESIGRTDLYKGDFQELERSIRERLYILPDQTRVLPGHGPETSIGHEKKFNPFVRG